jgi:diguanylate cyclase (GGDEF)-like protein
MVAPTAAAATSAASSGESDVARLARVGFPWLRFPPELERAFLAEYRIAHRVRIRVAICLALATVVGFAAMDRWLMGAGAPGLPDAVRFGVHLPIAIICLLLTSRRFYRWYWPTIQVAAPLFGLGTVTLAATATDPAIALIYARLVLVTFFFYFMLGLPFFVALRTNLIVFAGFAIAAWVSEVPLPVAMYQLFILLCANVFAGASSYALEHANRLAFLDRRLLQEVATRDGLTGLLNRTAFETEVRRAWQQALRDRKSVAVVMVDIDHFKDYNDRYGHQAGDECLRAVARAVRGAAGTRPLDSVARYGGEEMIAVLPGADRAGAETVARDILTAVAGLAIPHDRSLTRPYVTVSVGVASVLPERASSHDVAVLAADRALYVAKEEGRDRYAVLDDVVVAPDFGRSVGRELRTGS